MIDLDAYGQIDRTIAQRSLRFHIRSRKVSAAVTTNSYLDTILGMYLNPYLATILGDTNPYLDTILGEACAGAAGGQIFPHTHTHTGP